MDALNAEGCALYVDFLELIEEKIISFIEKLAFIFLVSHDVEILVTLPN